jgi:hypothetical protein
MKVLKMIGWFFIDLVGFRRVVEKYLPMALDIFLTMDAIADVVTHGVKAMRDGKLDKEERLNLAAHLELYRVVMDDVLVDIIEHLQEDNDAEELTDLDS